MCKTFIEPYILFYGIKVWGHITQYENDILAKLQSKIIRIIFSCARTQDAWRHCYGRINNINTIYDNVIKKLCMKHHFGMLPDNFSNTIMPAFNIDQLQNKISRISLDKMYDYKKSNTLMETNLKANCVNKWNELPLEIKLLPYSNSKDALYKTLRNFH